MGNPTTLMISQSCNRLYACYAYTDRMSEQAAITGNTLGSDRLGKAWQA